MFVGSYGHRYSDPLGTFVSRDRDALEDALEDAVQWEQDELPGYCEIAHDLDDLEDDCAFCSPDVVSYGIYQMTAHDLGAIVDADDLIYALRDARTSDSGVAVLER